MGFVEITIPVNDIKNYKSILKDKIKKVEKRINLLGNNIEKISLLLSLPKNATNGDIDAFFAVKYFVKENKINFDDYFYYFDNWTKENGYHVFWDIYYNILSSLELLETKLRRKISRLIKQVKDGKIVNPLDIFIAIEPMRKIKIEADNSGKINLHYYEDITMPLDSYEYKYTLTVSFYENCMEIFDNVFKIKVENFTQDEMEHYKKYLFSHLEFTVLNEYSFEKMKQYIYGLKNHLRKTVAHKITESENYEEKINTIKTLVEKCLENTEFYIWDYDIKVNRLYDTFSSDIVKEIDYENFYIYLISLEDEKLKHFHEELTKLFEKEKTDYALLFAEYMFHNLKKEIKKFNKETNINVDIVFVDNTFYFNLNIENIKPELDKKEVIDNVVNTIIDGNLYEEIRLDLYNFFKNPENLHIMNAIFNSIKPISKLSEFREIIISKILKLLEKFLNICKSDNYIEGIVIKEIK